MNQLWCYILVTLEVEWIVSKLALTTVTMAPIYRHGDGIPRMWGSQGTCIPPAIYNSHLKSHLYTCRPSLQSCVPPAPPVSGTPCTQPPSLGNYHPHIAPSHHTLHTCQGTLPTNQLSLGLSHCLLQTRFFLVLPPTPPLSRNPSHIPSHICPRTLHPTLPLPPPPLPPPPHPHHTR